jgi:hypothetical protein
MLLTLSSLFCITFCFIYLFFAPLSPTIYILSPLFHFLYKEHVSFLDPFLHTRALRPASADDVRHNLVQQS